MNLFLLAQNLKLGVFNGNTNILFKSLENKKISEFNKLKFHIIFLFSIFFI